MFDIMFFFFNSDLLHITGIGHGPISSSGTSLGSSPSQTSSPPTGNHLGSDILDRASHDLRLEKSNILLLGPTGCGEYLKNIILLLPVKYKSNINTT